MKTLYKGLVLLVIIVGSEAVVKGQQISDSLAYYASIALKNNPTVQQRYNEFQVALQKVPQASSLDDPTLSIGWNVSMMETLMGREIADVQLMQMFPWWGTLKAASDEMSLMADSKFQSYLDAMYQTYYEVQSAWYDLYKIDQTISYTEDNLVLLNTILRLQQIKFRASTTLSSSMGGSNSGGSAASPVMGGTMGGAAGGGGMGGDSMSGMGSMGGGTPSQSVPTVSPSSSSSMGGSGGMQAGSSMSSSSTALSDIYRIQIEISDLINSIELLKSQRITSQSRFNTLLNRHPANQVSRIAKMEIAAINPEVLISAESFLRNNPMLGMIDKMQESLNARKKMVTKMGYPMVGIGLNYKILAESPIQRNGPMADMNGKDMIMPMVQISLPIYRKKYKAMKAEVDFMKQQNRNSYDETLNSLQVEFYQAKQLYQDAVRRIPLYKAQKELTQKTMDIMIKSFSSSKSDLTDILRVRQQLLDYKIKEVEAITDNNSSIAWINRLMAATKIN